MPGSGAGYILRRVRRLVINATEGDKNYIRVSLLPACFRVLHGGIIVWLLLALCVGTALLLGVNGPLVRSAENGLIVFSLYKLLHGFMVEAVRQRESGRPLLNLPAPLAQHSYQTFHVILLFSAIYITIAGIIGSFEPRALEMLWRVYFMALFALSIWFVTPKSVFLELLPPPKTKVKKFQRGCIHVAHPLTIAFLVLLIAVNGLGYIALSQNLVDTLIGCVVTVVAVAVVRKLVTVFTVDRLARKRLAQGQESEFKATRGIIDYTSIIVPIMVIVSLVTATFVRVSMSPSAPALLRAFASEVHYVLEMIRNILQYKLGLGGEGYTTPLNIIVGVILVIIFFFIAAVIKGAVDSKLINKMNLEKGASATISSLVSYTIIAFSILFALSIAGIPLRSLAFFAGALGVGIGFGMQHIVNNFLSGIILLFERPVRVGDFIILSSDIAGTVQRIGPRSTTLQTPDSILVVVPNSKLMDGNIRNQSQPTLKVRAKLSIGVAYGTDVELVKRLLFKVATENPRVKKDPEPVVRFNEFADSYYDFQLIYWCDNGRERWHSISELNFAIERLFAEHNIEIPFPQRDINIRSVPPELPGKIESPKSIGQETQGKEAPS